MPNPYETLGLDPAAADDAAVRRRYLDLTREFPPEHHPAKSAAVRAAYDALKDADARARYRLFDAGADDTVDTILETVACQTPRRRWGLDALLKAIPPASKP